MHNNVIFILDNDKPFIELYSRILQNKGFQVFATDNLFILMKYAQTALPQWIFIDENYTQGHPQEIIKIINKGFEFDFPKYTLMNNHYKYSKNLPNDGIERIYKPHMLEKIIQLSESCCNQYQIN